MKKINRIPVKRTGENTILVGDKECINIHGIYYPKDDSSLGMEKINAIWEFLDNEKKELEQKALNCVRELLMECKIKYIK